MWGVNVPIFEYKCQACKKITEEIVSSSSIKSIRCPQCGKKSIQQFPTNMTFELKYDPKRDKFSWGKEGYSRTRRYEEIDKKM
jgi:putative FmdB family regulatory protein